MTRCRVTVGFLLVVSLTAAANIAWAEQLRHLAAAEIRAHVIGKRITDDGHWSQTFERSGRLIVNDLGRPSTGSWSIRNDTLCNVRAGILDACYEVWLSGNEIQLRVPGTKDAMTVFLRSAGSR